MSINIKTRAKINLSLEILGKLSDGYHDLSMIMQSIGIEDDITLKKIFGSDIIVKTNNLDINNCDNITYKIAKSFMEYTGIKSGVEIIIDKKIPIGAGLAGGSSNGAGVLLALDKMFKTNLSDDELINISKSVGSDIPFCLFGGTMKVMGKGEILEKLSNLDIKLLIVKPDKSIDTKEAFSLIDISDYSFGERTEILKNSINEGVFFDNLSNMTNSMYEKSLTIVPEMAEIVKSLEDDYGCNKAMMSGSGSTIFAIFDNDYSMREAYNFYKKIYKDVYITNSVDKGIVIL